MTTLHHETKSFIDMSGPDGPRLVQLPGLDGLHGVAVAAVVVYHMGFGWMVGGYLGVSTFFTLSGFLITSILLKESQRTGGVSLGRFWARRFRGLMPAAVVTLMIVVTLYGRTVATADQRLALRGDVRHCSMSPTGVSSSPARPMATSPRCRHRFCISGAFP